VNAVLADRKTGRPEPLVAYGTWLNWQHEPAKDQADLTAILDGVGANYLLFTSAKIL